ncbi:hypothetical protein HRI_000287500 [Hibiscus trionum]|uniref:RNase H type-1 domain-containing protein n=1 Tax=Hibiscus trionum TaxID=183268 RepID=A0A9W7LJ44_HIBTR|nr:hypothetical protein HRI_000287500 [Hibiscus trionum]
MRLSIRRKKVCEDSLFDAIVIRIGYWCKCKWPTCFTSMLDFVKQLNICSVDKGKAIKPPIGSWVAPPFGVLKFNVDASVLGRFGLGGVGGILRDHKGNHLLKFSRCIDMVDPTREKILSILEACCLFHSSFENTDVPLIIESDSQLAVQ